jgi:hypothetical protein
LARPAEDAVKPKVITHQQSLTTAIPPDLPRGATGSKGLGGADAGPGDEGEKELVVVRG